MSNNALMTTARDVIAKALADRFDGEFDPVYLEDADGILRALIAAPEPVRLGLAALLCPSTHEISRKPIAPWSVDWPCPAPPSEDKT